MNSRERVIATLEFKNPDKIPVNLWVSKATYLRYGIELVKMLEKYELDIERVSGPMDKSFYPESFQVGEYKDIWGCTWKVVTEGMFGEVKIPAIDDINRIRDYNPPIDLLESEWEKYNEAVEKKTQEHRKKNKFILGGGIEIFQRMQFIRGAENLFYDIGEQNENVIVLRDMIVEFYKEYLRYWFEKDVDGIMFLDDWGSQSSLLISPKMWRDIFKPVYKELIDMIKKQGKYVFFHTDGYILDLFPDFIEIGVDAINSQLWCMGVENVARKFAGKITFWGEIDRQKILPYGSAKDVCNAARTMKDFLFVNGGGLIGQSIAEVDIPIENIEAILYCWNKL